MMARPTNWAQIVWREDDTPYAPDYDDGYFGEADPAAEARHVFSKGLALPQAWQTFFDEQNPFRIVELGFATGMNFLQTAHLWQEWLHGEKQRQGRTDGKVEHEPFLDYWGIEARPWHIEDLQRFYRRHKVYGRERLLQVWQDINQDTNQDTNKDLTISDDKDRSPLVRLSFAPSLRLTLLLQDVESALATLQALFARKIDGWYCDGFAPKRNPAMWSEQVFSAMSRCTRARAGFPQLASFSVAKSVRTTAKTYGFRTRKRKGWLAKREVLQGFFQEDFFQEGFFQEDHAPPLSS